MFSRSARWYDAIYSFKDYAGEAAKVDRLIRERRPHARTLLDVACGTGKHLEHFAVANYEVEGVDLDPQLLEIARQRLPSVRFHQADMAELDIGRRFDAVTCLFSSIGYAKTDANLRRAIGAMARHLEPGGVLVVEPWLPPEGFTPGHIGAAFHDEPELKIARINSSVVEDGVSIMDFHYLVGTPDRIEHFTERHELGLFTDEQYGKAFTAAGLRVDYDAEGLMGRGLYIGTAAML